MSTTGRPSSYTQEIADAICERLENGESLRFICSDESMPCRSTVLRWRERDEAFDTRCARARDDQAEYMDDLILDTAKNCTADNFQVARVQISAYQWRASKLKPKKYGDRTVLAGDPNAPLEIRSADDLTDEQLATIAAAGRPAPTEPQKGED